MRGHGDATGAEPLDDKALLVLDVTVMVVATFVATSMLQGDGGRGHHALVVMQALWVLAAASALRVGLRCVPLPGALPRAIVRRRGLARLPLRYADLRVTLATSRTLLRAIVAIRIGASVVAAGVMDDRSILIPVVVVVITSLMWRRCGAP